LNLDEEATVILKLKDGQEHTFSTLRKSLLFAWSKDCENVESIKWNNELVVLQRDIFKA